MAETLMRMYETMSETEQKELYDFALFLLSRNEEKAKPIYLGFVGARAARLQTTTSP